MAVESLKTRFEQLMSHPDYREGEHWRWRDFKKGEKIIKCGEEDSDIYIIVEGCARVVGDVDLGSDKSIHPGVCDLSTGDFFGEIALFDQQPRSATIEAVEACKTIQVDGQKLLKFLDNHPNLGYQLMQQLMRVMVDRLRNSNKKIFSLLAWGLKAHNIDTHL